MSSNRPFRRVLLSALVAFIFVATSVGAVSVSAEGPTGAGVVEVDAANVAATNTCKPYATFNPASFTSPTDVDNRWFPLIPGTRYVLEGRANRTGAALPHTVIFTVTDLTKVINGVRSLVMWDRDINAGVLSEAELAFFAQDRDENVWNMGEYPEEYANGVFAGAPSTWIAGLAGATAGVHMPGVPLLGSPSYSQGKAPAIGFYDCGQVFAMLSALTVPAGRYRNLLVTDEWSPLDPASGHQRKYHAPDVGIVQVGAVNDPEGETLVLKKLVRLTAQQMTVVRREALKLEAHAYEVSPLYRRTLPMEVGRP